MGLAATFRLMRAGYILAREGAFSIVDPAALPPVMRTGVRFARLFERHITAWQRLAGEAEQRRRLSERDRVLHDRDEEGRTS